jgi:hypothetical protein
VIRPGSFQRVSVRIDYDDPGRAVPKDFLGLSYESSKLASPGYFSPANGSVVGLVQGLGKDGVLRLGGNMSESTTWLAAGGGLQQECFVITPAAIDALGAFLDAVDWRLIYGLNLARGTPESAADEAAYVANAVGPRLLAFQIGNEPDGFGQWRNVRSRSYDCAHFLAEWNEFRDAVVARIPDASFAGPDIAVENSWIRPFIETAGRSLVLVTRHHYADGPAGAPHLSIDKLLAAAPRVDAMLKEVVSVKETTGLPFRIAETNSIFNEGEPGVSDTFASALWGIEYMLQLAEAGASGLNFHTGDAKAYTPIAPKADGSHGARPLYYAMLMFREAVRDAVLLSTRVSAADVNLAAFAARASDGALNICLINKALDDAVRVEIEDSARFQSASVLWLTADSARATSGVTFAGGSVDAFGHWTPGEPKILPWQSEPFVDLPPASAALLRLS